MINIVKLTYYNTFHASKSHKFLLWGQKSRFWTPKRVQIPENLDFSRFLPFLKPINLFKWNNKWLTLWNSHLVILFMHQRFIKFLYEVKIAVFGPQRGSKFLKISIFIDFCRFFRLNWHDFQLISFVCKSTQSFIVFFNNFYSIRYRYEL